MMRSDDVELGKQILNDSYLAGKLLLDFENAPSRRALLQRKNFPTLLQNAIILSSDVRILTQLCPFLTWSG